MKTVYLKITPINLAISIPVELPWKRDVQIFKTSTPFTNIPSVQCDIKFVQEFRPIFGNLLYSSPAMQVMKIDQIEYRIHILPNSSEPFALTRHLNDDCLEVLIDQRALPRLKWDRNLVGLFSLEHYCLQYQAFILHASYIVHQNQAILFTAPSGTGKSTQADLWAKYENAEIINGDRVLIYYNGTKWMAAGFPVCGSSTFCENQTAPIKTIICLAQSKQNILTSLSPIEALKKIYSQAFVNNWNAEDCRRITKLIISLVQEVPIYNYSCTKEKDAVSYLEKNI